MGRQRSSPPVVEVPPTRRCVPPAHRDRAAAEPHAAEKPHNRMASDKAREAMLHRSDTNAPANHGPRASSALDAGVDGNTDGRDNAHPAARRNTGTADRAMRGDRSPQTPRVEASRVVTGLVTVFLARSDFRWLALTNPRLLPCRKRPANGAIWLAMTYGSDGTRTRDLRRDRTALWRYGNSCRRAVPSDGRLRPSAHSLGGTA